MNAGKITAGILVALAVVTFFSIFIVKEVNQAIVLQFGDPKRIILKSSLFQKLLEQLFAKDCCGKLLETARNCSTSSSFEQFHATCFAKIARAVF